jgi:hemerythrin superfamily protein
MTQQDACTLLDTDHQKVERLFTEYQSAQDATKKSQLAQEICMELTVHAIIEEEIFYPAFVAATRDDDLVEEAQEEHQQAKDLIAEIEDGDKIDALMARLQKAIEHHVKDERTEMFPKARKAAGMDLMALAAQLETRKQELMANYQPV